MVVDIHQGPYAWTQRKLQIFDPQENLESPATEFLSALEILTRIASDELASIDALSVKVQPLIFGSRKGKYFLASKSQLELTFEADSDKSDVVSV